MKVDFLQLGYGGIAGGVTVVRAPPEFGGGRGRRGESRVCRGRRSRSLYPVPSWKDIRSKHAVWGNLTDGTDSLDERTDSLNYGWTARPTKRS